MRWMQGAGLRLVRSLPESAGVAATRGGRVNGLYWHMVLPARRALLVRHFGTEYVEQANGLILPYAGARVAFPYTDWREALREAWPVVPPPVLSLWRRFWAHFGIHQ